MEGGQIPMCTLRNFPQITDHCIEWARDQFALLFIKLIKYVETYLQSPRAFEEEMLSMTDTAQSIFIIRSVHSLVKALKTPSQITSLAQCGYDIFHFLFRDRILDLQNTFPKNKRILDKDGRDKGPFWGEKKKYPTVAVFNIQDESHSNFLLATICLFGAGLNIIPVKDENDELWCSEYKKPGFMESILKELKIPEYVFSPVNTTDDEDNNATAAASATDTAAAGNTNVPVIKKEELLANLLQSLATDSITITNTNTEPNTFNYADFEKDDDNNFHISFVTSAANLRCDNYSITRTNFHQCKVIAGKIIAAIATTTAAVCGLVMLELFKLCQDKPTDSYMNRQIGLAMNTFTSFTADPPNKFKTMIEKTLPAVEDTTAGECMSECCSVYVRV